MYIVDMHCDTLSCVSGERGLINRYNLSNKAPQLQFFAHFSTRGELSPEIRRRRLIQAANVYLAECDRLGISTVSSGKDLFNVTDNSLRAGMLTLEGGGGLFADSPELDTLYRAGLRVMGLAWDSNELSACAWDKTDTSLSDEGRRMVERCAQIGITVDLSHLSDRAIHEVFEISPMPHIATHSNFRSVCPSRRNLTDEMARLIAARGGVIGLNLYPEFLSEQKASKDDILRHVDYGLELVGDRCLGFGFDIDGTDGEYPNGISTDSSIHDQVIDLLLSRYPSSVVERIAGQNVLDFLKGNLT